MHECYCVNYILDMTNRFDQSLRKFSGFVTKQKKFNTNAATMIFLCVAIGVVNGRRIKRQQKEIAQIKKEIEELRSEEDFLK